MFSNFNANLQTDIGKTIVRRLLDTTDAQSLWRELSEHMRTSSKGVSDKRRLTQYITNTVLDDIFKGTTEQFVLHFTEPFRQLDEISDDSEKLPPTVKVTLLQTAVRSINDLRIAETLDEFQSTTQGHGSSTSLSFQTYYDLLINACARYDKTKKANIGKRMNVYNSKSDTPYVDYPTDVTEFRQPLQVQSHLEMPRILVQLGHTQRTQKLAPQTDPKRSPTRSVTRYQDQISVKCTRWTLRMPSFTRAPHAQPSLSNFTRRDSDFGEPTRSRGTTRLEQNFPTSPQNKKTKLTHRLLYMSLRTILTPHVN